MSRLQISSNDLAEQQLQEEVKAASMAEVIPRVLDVICKITGMRFAAMARVTDFTAYFAFLAR